MRISFVRVTCSIGGGVLLGLAGAMLIARESILAFVGTVLIGLGLGIIVAALISKRED